MVIASAERRAASSIGRLMPRDAPRRQRGSAVPLAPRRAPRVESDHLAAQRGPRKPFGLDLAARGGERPARCGTHDLGVVLVGYDDPAAFGAELGVFEARAVEFGRQAPVEPVA